MNVRFKNFHIFILSGTEKNSVRKDTTQLYENNSVTSKYKSNSPTENNPCPMVLSDLIK